METKVVGRSSGQAGIFVIGLLAGGLAGAAATLLLMPRSGKRTRERIRHTAIGLRGTAQEALAQAREKVEAVAADLRCRVEELGPQSHVVLEERPGPWVQTAAWTCKAAAVAPEERE
jgi:hypothetical protein